MKRLNKKKLNISKVKIVNVSLMKQIKGGTVIGNTGQSDNPILCGSDHKVCQD